MLAFPSSPSHGTSNRKKPETFVWSSRIFCVLSNDQWEITGVAWRHENQERGF